MSVFLVQLKRCWRSSTFLLREHVFISNRESDFGRYFNVIHFLNVVIFRWRNFFKVIFSGVALLSWFTKSSKFEEGFNDNGYHDHLLDISTVWCYYQYYYNKPESICYLIRSWKKILYCNILCNIWIHHSFEDNVI